MAGNVLWTSVFNKPDSQSQDLTRQRIVQEERCGRRPATTTPGPEYDRMVRGQGAKLLDPWAPPPDASRKVIQPPLVGYGGTIPMVRPEHTGQNRGEFSAHFVPHFGASTMSISNSQPSSCLPLLCFPAVCYEDGALIVLSSLCVAQARTRTRR